MGKHEIYKNLAGKSERKREPGKRGQRWKDNIKWILQKWSMRIWIGLMWLRMTTNGGLL
jgi:hypothetical protein